jgi:alkylation response protein AidB-like acyl-CoA dehydrogenase
MPWRPPAAWRSTGRCITSLELQWISNGGIADVYTFLAKAPGGPSWFIIEKSAAGLSHGKAEDKHGIRASNTAAVWCETGERRCVFGSPIA